MTVHVVIILDSLESGIFLLCGYRCLLSSLSRCQIWSMLACGVVDLGIGTIWIGQTILRGLFVDECADL